MLIYPFDPFLGGPMHDTDRRDQLFGGNGIDYFILQRDGKTDTVWHFEDGRDRIDLSAFEVTWDSVMVKQVDTYEWVITIRDEKTRIVFDPPQPGAPAIDLSADDFIFADGLPDPPLQSIQDMAGLTHLNGTSLPDAFDMIVDGSRDVIHHFELGKDIIDLSAFNTNFAALEFVDKKPGRIVIKVDNGGGQEHIVVKDHAKAFTSADFAADDFLF